MVTIKKKHHIIPEVYLKEFVDSSKPDNFPVNTPYTPAFWRIDKFMESEPTLKSPEKSFRKNRFYKLDGDSDEYQVIEETLSKIETNYSISLKKIKNIEALTSQDLINFIVFVETLHHRVESHIEYWQKTFSKFEKIYREVDQAHNNNQKHSDEYWKSSHEIGKKLVISGIGTMGELIMNEGIYFLLNESEMPFISSDKPVLWTHGHIDEFQLCNIPRNWLKGSLKTNQKEFFCYCPLTPEIALFSSPFFQMPDSSIYQYWQTRNSEFIFSMNYLTHTSADQVIISNKSNPYANYERRIKNYLRSKITVNFYKGKKMLIYTSDARYWLKIEEYTYASENPILVEIEFWTNELDTLKLIANDEIIESIQIYEDGVEMASARRLKFDKVSLQKEESSILKQVL